MEITQDSHLLSGRGGRGGAVAPDFWVGGGTGRFTEGIKDCSYASFSPSSSFALFNKEIGQKESATDSIFFPSLRQHEINNSSIFNPRHIFS